jgi:uncharacterized protein YycO
MRILLYQGVSLLSRLIKWRTWSEWSHVAIQVGGGQVIDAWKGGVRLIDNPFEGHDPATVVQVLACSCLTAEQEQRIADFLVGEIGAPYDYWGVLRFVSRRDRPNPLKWFCSELAFAAFQQAGIDLLARVPSWRVSPGDVAHSPLLKLERRLEQAKRSAR